MIALSHRPVFGGEGGDLIYSRAGDDTYDGEEGYEIVAFTELGGAISLDLRGASPMQSAPAKVRTAAHVQVATLSVGLALSAADFIVV